MTENRILHKQNNHIKKYEILYSFEPESNEQTKV